MQPTPQHRVVVGTAGHIDHGKTRLLEALTGVDCDRWAEEKARGITIDLGFTHLLEGDLQVGFVDVPGHEKFLHNALAGLGGIRLVLLVVAADEGVKPQTREHLDVCTLLGIPHALVAITKKDLVDEETLELAQLEVEELLETTPLAGSPLVPVSSLTGEGIDELRQAILERGREIAVPVDPQQPFRLPIDRAFQLEGLGAIVTGTLVSGRVETGQTLEVLPRGARARVRSVQVHGQERPRAEAGERTALQLAGVDLADLARGEQLVTPELFAAGPRLAGRLDLLPDAPSALGGWTPIRFHLYSTEAVGRIRSLGEPIEPGASGWVELRLGQGIVAVRGDRFIVRRPSPPLTLGGGVVLDPRWLRRRAADLPATIEALEDDERVLDLWVAETGARGLDAEALAPRLGQRPDTVAKALAARAAEGKLLKVAAGSAPRYLDPAVFPRVGQKAKALLKTYFRDNRLARGMPKAEFLARLLPRAAQNLAEIYLRFLAAEKIARVDGDVINPHGRKVEGQLTGEESQLSRDLLAAIEAEGLTPPSPLELARKLDTKIQILEGVQKYLLQQGKLVRLSSGLVLAASAVDTLRQELHDSDWERFSVPEFKDRYGLSRKWAIPLLEHLDSVGATRRLGNERQVIRRR